MRRKPSLRSVRRWPRWTIIPIGILLAGIIIALGLLLEPVGYALSPGKAKPEPTLPAVRYARAESDGCHDCHASLEDLGASADDPVTASDYLIEPESVLTAHGTLGCVACHAGNGLAEDKETGHKDLVADISQEDPKQCLICHTDLPAEIPGDRLRVPHKIVEGWIAHGEPGSVFCSDCHGGVGHGFDPVSDETYCPMDACLDCHEERNLEIQEADCAGCHGEHHDVSDTLVCDDCHSSAEEWSEIEGYEHPEELSADHGDAACFDCHQYPNFKGLDSACDACHATGHEEWGDLDCAECHDEGAAVWADVVVTWPGHEEPWDQYKGVHAELACRACHFETYVDLPAECEDCHQRVPDTHRDEKYTRPCVDCHQSDEEWEDGTKPEDLPSP